jgi:helix-turn-helix protein
VVPPNARESRLRKEIGDLKRSLADKALEADFFQRRLARSRGSTSGEARLWRADIYRYIRGVMFLQGGLSIERMCRLANVGRAGLYRSLEPPAKSEDEAELRSVIQKIVLEHHQRYGYRRVSAELRRRGIVANHTRVARIKREDNLLVLGSKGDSLHSPPDGFDVHS